MKTWIVRVITAVVATAVVMIAVRAYSAFRTVDPSEVLPIVAAVDRTAALIEADGNDQSAVDLQRLSAKLELARRGITAGGLTREDSRRRLLSLLDSTAADLHSIQVALATGNSARFAVIAQLRSQVNNLRDRVAQSHVTPLSGEWLADFVKMLVWPLFAGILLVYLFASKAAPGRIADLFRPFASIKLFGAEVSLSAETKHRAEEAFQVYRSKIKSSFDLQVQRYRLADKVRDLVDQTVTPFLTSTLNKDPRNSSVRCTLHVPDLLFADHLYQLLDYYPDYPGAEKHGRVWPIYFGLIGKVWRAGVSEVSGKVPIDPDLLIDEWGMTREQANRAGKGRQSFLGVLLKDPRGNQLGIVYLDAAPEWTFSANDDDTRIYDIVVRACEERGLTESLASMTENLRDQALLIKLHG